LARKFDLPHAETELAEQSVNVLPEARGTG
jgi:hypothetical protein